MDLNTALAVEATCSQLGSRYSSRPEIYEHAMFVTAENNQIILVFRYSRTKVLLMELLNNYINIVPSLIAIINTVIAVWVAQFKPERIKLKIALLITAIVLGLAAAGATTFAQYQQVKKEEADKIRMREIREKIGEFISSGNRIDRILCIVKPYSPDYNPADFLLSQYTTVY
jgi:hypothetical protein